MGQYARQVFPEDRFDEVIDQLDDGLHEEVRRTAHAVRNRARQYIVKWNAIVTGDLWRSVTVEMQNGGRDAEVYAGVEYASFVHDGTEKMDRRPFLAQAIEDQAPETEARLADLAGRLK